MSSGVATGKSFKYEKQFAASWLTPHDLAAFNNQAVKYTGPRANLCKRRGETPLAAVETRAGLTPTAVS